MGGISLVPGTNQLIYNNPGQGSNLFNKYGYSINRPGWGDYYNGLRRHGMPFFYDLGQLLHGFLASKSPIMGAAKVALLGPAGAAASTLIGGGAASIPGIGVSAGSLRSLPFLTDSPVGGLVDSAGVASMAFTGEDCNMSNWDGHDPVDKIRAYHELMEHLQRNLWRDRLPYYGYPYPIGVQYIQPIPLTDHSGPAQLGPGTSAQVMPEHNDTIFGINKKLVIAGTIALVIVLYLKFRK